MNVFLHRLDNTRGTFADSGTYALMGAAGTFVKSRYDFVDISYTKCS